ncbi:hypothetical protein L7F22_037882 [Adiantum nelumboides]|nr:hypothetical protein [Adiantum nelumboides]
MLCTRPPTPRRCKDMATFFLTLSVRDGTASVIYWRIGFCCKSLLSKLHKYAKQVIFIIDFDMVILLKLVQVYDIDMGKKIHDIIATQGLLKTNIMLGNALVDMYAKCGVLTKAQFVFDELSVRNAISWSALIAGFAQQGQSQEALDCFQRMRNEGFSPTVSSWNALLGGYAQQGLAKEALDCFQWMQQEDISPDAITFVNVLNACSHSGLVDEGQLYFHNMKEKYGIAPDKEHFTCMVDLFGRARLFGKAMRVIKTMPSSDYPPVWSALLGACQKWGNVKLGKFAFERAIQLDECDAAAYVLMTNIYAAAGMQEEAEIIKRMKMKNAA